MNKRKNDDCGLKGKTVLVTGGAGSIGREIVRQLLLQNPKKVRVFDHDEGALFAMQQDFHGERRIAYLIGDIRDRERLSMATEGVETVFHAAALKHVPFCEYNPFEAVKTNVLGTQNLIDAALRNGVGRVIAISTDKATHPVNTMGATKLLSERLMASAHYFKGWKKTIFASVRFGNVLYSSGSVVPLFIEQLKKGGTLRVTDPEMTRFIMSIEDAVGLIFKANEIMCGGEIFILKMPVVKLKDLTRAIIQVFAPEFGISPAKVRIKTVGIRPGEKIYESLMTDEESRSAFETKDMFILLPYQIPFVSETVRTYAGSKSVNTRSYSSQDAVLMPMNDLTEMLRKEKKRWNY